MDEEGLEMKECVRLCKHTWCVVRCTDVSSAQLW